MIKLQPSADPRSTHPDPSRIGLFQRVHLKQVTQDVGVEIMRLIPRRHFRVRDLHSRLDVRNEVEQRASTQVRFELVRH